MTTIVGIATLAVAMAGPADSAADAITLRDGSVVLGQVVEPVPRGRMLVVVRRAWAEKALPKRYKAWVAAEGASTKKARVERLRRLEEWKRDRDATPAEKDDAIGPWLVAEIAHLKDNAGPTPLMVATFTSAEVKATARRPADVARKLRQAWIAGFEDAETRPVAALTSALEGRGFAMTDVDPAPIDTLLPLPSETENRWRARRAATEVNHDRGLRFIRAHGVVLPEPAAGEAPEIKDVLGGLKGLLGADLDGPEADPLAGPARQVADRGRIGLIVTRMDPDGDLGGVKVEVALLVRTAQGAWVPATTRAASVRAADLKPGEGNGLENDPQVKAIFQGIEGLGLSIPAELKQQGLMAGAATQKALAQARTAIQPDLDVLALPIGPR